MSEHAKYSPSDADRWGPGGCDVALIDFPKSDDDEVGLHTLEGQDAHFLLELCLRHQKQPADHLGKDVFSGTHPGVKGEKPDPHVRQEMVDALEPVMDYITDRFFHREDETPTMWSEAHSTLVPKLCSGTVDCALYWPKAGILEVIDLKYGKGVMVEADAPQLGIYAAAIARDMKCKKLHQVFTTIAQPRGHHPAGPIRTFERTGADLMLFAENIKGRIDYLEGLNGKAEGNPTKDACMWCPGKKNGCTWRTKIAADSATRIIEEQHPEEVPSGTPFTTDELFLIENAEVIEAVLKSARSRLVDQILAGGEDHGYTLEESRANRIFVHGADEMKEILNKKFRMKVADITTPKLNGIPAIEKVAKKVLSEAKLEEFQTLIEKPRGGPKLVRKDEAKGKPYMSAESMFEKTDEVDFM